ncbi:hypothetical protein ACH4NO_18190 [Streptomyces olivaceus]|uniref:hypothetical protein n=1 Tax=Streptomyces olivaceus TaxID=47716 RepID=UPI0037965D5D
MPGRTERLLADLDADLARRMVEAEALDALHPGLLDRFERAVREDRESRFKTVQRTGRGLPPRPLGPDPKTLIPRR